MNNEKINKYPRTQHIEGSNEQIGDDLAKVPFDKLAGKHLVVEEKQDGSNSAISFSSDGDLLLKQMAKRCENDLFDMLGDRYIMYGEWMYAKHTIFYNLLPSYFMEFDIFDKYENVFLDTERRFDLKEPYVDVMTLFPAVRVLNGDFHYSYDELVGLVGDSAFVNKETVMDDFIASINSSTGANLDVELNMTDISGVMEGLYIKVEEDGIVKERYKWVRKSFTQKVIDSDRHWQSRPIVKNLCFNRII